MVVSKRIVLHFPKELVDRPIVFRLVKDYNLEFNILKALVTPREEGLMVLELNGGQEEYDRGIRYLTTNGVRIESLSQNVSRDEERCTHCGACITLCPNSAFEVEASARRIIFHSEKCIGCKWCIKACPVRAMKVYF